LQTQTSQNHSLLGAGEDAASLQGYSRHNILGRNRCEGSPY